MSFSERFRSALFEQLNIVLIAAFAIFSLVTWNWWPAVVGGVAELLYLAVVPGLPVYTDRLRKKEEREKRELLTDRTRAAMESLPQEDRQLYRRLVDTGEEIKKNYRQLHPTTQQFLDAITAQLDRLLNRYLTMRQAYVHSVRYLDSTSVSELQRKLDEVTATLEREGNMVHDVEEKQKKILELRLVKRAKAEENTHILKTQLDTIEQFILLLKDQSFTLRDPKEISSQIDSMMSEVESTESTVKELEAFFGEET